MSRYRYLSFLVCVALALPAGLRAEAEAARALRRVIVGRARAHASPEVLPAVAALDEAGFLDEVVALALASGGGSGARPSVEELEARTLRWAEKNLLERTLVKITTPLGATVREIVTEPGGRPGQVAVLVRLQLEYRLQYQSGEARKQEVYYSRRWVLFSPDFEVVERVSDPVERGDPAPAWVGVGGAPAEG